MKIIGVNGIRTHGKDNVDVLLYTLQRRGHAIHDLWLPKRNTIGAWSNGPKDAELIVDVAEPGDVIIAHSFGCLRTAYALQKLEGIKAVFLFRPAMDRRWQFNVKDTSVYCIHSADDIPIFFGGIIPFHPFGHAGRKGFKQKGVINWQSIGRHGADFTFDPLRHFWADRIEWEIAR